MEPKLQTIANYFIHRAAAEQKEMTIMKLLKLVYFADGWSLSIARKRMINEDFMVWKYGPVACSLYKLGRDHGSRRIEATIGSFSELLLSDLDVRILDFVWDKYGGLDGWRLSLETHKEGTPWDIAWKNGGEKRWNEKNINTDVALLAEDNREYFNTLLNQVGE
jgi:uncharacterized phage-associated protein